MHDILFKQMTEFMYIHMYKVLKFKQSKLNGKIFINKSN